MLISYAQNFEDVILWRALKHVERGFYIDIGAQDPVIDSVSLAFYEKGWRGVHVEPTPAYAAKLRSARAEEDVIEAAIARSPGVITLFEIAETGLSTGKQEIVQMHADSGFAAKSIEVEALPLSELFTRYPDREIHWLKIDVEGMEDEVIASWQPALTRPWVVVVESTVPRSQQPDYSGWESDLLALGYEFAYFDGLNRFYLHRDHKELRPAFSNGPNVFDDFALSGLASSPFALKLNSDIVGLKSELKVMSDQKQVDLAEIGRLHRHILDTDRSFAAERTVTAERVLQAEQQAIVVEQLNRQLAAMRRSSSWRLTAPLRGVKHGARVSAGWPRAKAKLGLEHALLWLRRRPRAAATAKFLLRYSPWLEQRSLAFSRSRPPSASVVGWALEPDKNVLNEWRKLLRVSRTS